jgi:hypothetical protein
MRVGVVFACVVVVDTRNNATILVRSETEQRKLRYLYWPLSSPSNMRARQTNETETKKKDIMHSNRLYDRLYHTL